MKGKIRFLNLLLAVFCILTAVFVVSPIINVANIPANLIFSEKDVNGMDIRNVTCGVKENKLEFKLFNLFRIRSLPVVYEAQRKAYVGGFPIGINLKTDGVLVVSRIPVETTVGKVMPECELKAGDVIQSINGKKILHSSDIFDALSGCNGANAKIGILRKGEALELDGVPVKENFTNQYRLGLNVRDSLSGLGTVSYVKLDGSFGSLGHPISDGETGSILPCYDGNVYNCKVLGVEKSVKGNPGEIRGTFASEASIGKVYKNNKFGLFGKFNKLYNDGKIYDVGNRFSVNIGKAEIYTSIDDGEPQLYSIEIIRALNQNTPNDKSMIIRVTDKRLLEKCGGIIQGMSGSPIIQNNRIIGSVTHVFLNDPTKGYGVYLDWMYQN